MGFKSSIADPDIGFRPATKPDGEQYYEFILVYVDNILSISQYAVSVIREDSYYYCICICISCIG